jgi:hypothetical protein
MCAYYDKDNLKDRLQNALRRRYSSLARFAPKIRRRVIVHYVQDLIEDRVDAFDKQPGITRLLVDAVARGDYDALLDASLDELVFRSVHRYSRSAYLAGMMFIGASDTQVALDARQQAELLAREERARRRSQSRATRQDDENTDADSPWGTS